MTVLQQILEYKIVAILRGCSPDRVPDIAAALARGGIRLLEITLNSPGALEAIRQLTDRMGDQLLIGAGTVLTAGEAEEAIAAGARFILSPSLDFEIIRTTRELGAVSIPGAFTATEILTAYKNGADIVKLFPASVGVHYFRDIRGPLPLIPLMPTGGVNLNNIWEFHAAGAVAFGIGSALVPAGQLATKEALHLLTEKAAAYMHAVHPGKTAAPGQTPHLDKL
jgi:2-dehydro-3-deoxyphosphogluconate aldolase / (4S)-4-hydroxy-2-oxoglutarate aldolase